MEREYTRHPASAAWPDLTTKEYENLRASIRKSGFHGVIPATQDKQIFDHWHGYVACLDERVEPPIKVHDLDAQEIADWIVGAHKGRRHMAPRDIAEAVVRTLRACGLAFADEKGGRPKTEPDGSVSGEHISTRHVADLAGTSQRTAARVVANVKTEESGEGKEKDQGGGEAQDAGKKDSPELPPAKTPKPTEPTFEEVLQGELDVALTRAEEAEARVEALMEKIAIISDGNPDPDLEAVKRERVKAVEIQVKLERASKLANSRGKKLTSIRNELLKDETDNSIIVGVLRKQFGVKRNSSPESSGLG